MYKNSESLISVIIPVYNTESYLRECLDSVLGNTYKELQIICVNDGSTDGSLGILFEYEQNDSRIVVIDKPNGGVSSARNAGLTKADGDYISFVDSDDVILDCYYEKLLKVLQDNNADLIDTLKSTDIQYNGNENFIVFDNYGIIKNKAMRTYVAGKIYKRSIISDCWFRENLCLYEDCIFNLDLMKKAITENQTLKGILLNAPMYRYTSRSGSAMHQSSYEKAKPSIDYLRDVACQNDNTDVATIYAIECIRKCLLSWYQMFLHGKRECCRKIKYEMRFVLKYINHSSIFSIKEVLPFIVFAWIPQLYRQFRLYDDPTMKQYEKTVRSLK